MDTIITDLGQRWFMERRITNPIINQYLSELWPFVDWTFRSKHYKYSIFLFRKNNLKYCLKYVSHFVQALMSYFSI